MPFRPNRRRILALASLGSLAAAAAWLWPLDRTQPVTVWFPTEAQTRGALMRSMNADPAARVVAIHAANIIVMQSDDPFFPFKLIATGAVPFSLRAGDAICRS